MDSEDYISDLLLQVNPDGLAASGIIAIVSIILLVIIVVYLILLLMRYSRLLPENVGKFGLLRKPQNVTPDIADHDEQEMIDDILHFYHKTADEIMIPRLDMTAIDMKCDMKEVLDIVIKSGYSRIPIYEDTEDNIKGILYVKDLLPAIVKPESIQWRNLIRPTFFVPETKKIDDLLENFKANKIHIAIVVDEFGCTSGLVTMEDILEEIVGDISDEYDNDEKHFLRLPDGSYIFEGKIQINDFFRETNINENDFEKIPEEVDTLAGLLLKIKGTLPRRREVIDYKKYRFRILEADERRILKVKVSLNQSPPTGNTILSIILCLIYLGAGFMSCIDAGSMPKPRGFYRIDLPQAQYSKLMLADLPYSFNVSQLVTVELPESEQSTDWINIDYPSLNATVYCSYHRITPSDLPVLEAESKELVSRSVRNTDAITVQEYENNHIHVYGTLFRIEGETASPLQFMLTDSSTRFFRGALYFNCKPNVDSLAPVTHYLDDNVVELIQSFRWKPE
ncbi:MAG: hemolysin family protein [Tannerella sp.]|nr:hemolysin family protein [Tannerella sp.]